MAKPPKKDEPEIDPRGGDEILKRMLKSKPKTHAEMVEARTQIGKKKSGKRGGRA